MLGVCGAELCRGMAPREISREGTRPARGCELEGGRARPAAALVPISAFSDSSALSSGAAAPIAPALAAPAPDSWAASSPGLHHSSLSHQQDLALVGKADHGPEHARGMVHSGQLAARILCSDLPDPGQNGESVPIMT